MTVQKKSTAALRAKPVKKRSVDIAIRLINETLRGPVVDVFIENIPGLQGLSRERAYDLIMNNPELADCCFKLFRKKPELFATLLVGPNRQPIVSEEDLLRCGRTTPEVVELIVRAVAKRHFRAKLSPRAGTARPIAAPPSPPGLWARFMRMLGAALPPPPVRKKRKATRADSLYQAMHDNLRYEWQVNLIPHYVPLPVPLVRQLGARILEFREPAQLRDLALTGVAPALPAPEIPPEPVAPVAEDGRAKAGEARKPAAEKGGMAPPPLRSSGLKPTAPTVASAPAVGGGAPSSKSEVMWTLSQTMDLPILLGIDEATMRTVIAHISGVGALTMNSLNAAGLRLREAVVVLAVADLQLGHARLRALFGAEADPKFLQAFSQSVRTLNIPALRDPLEIRDSVIGVLDSLRAAGVLRD